MKFLSILRINLSRITRNRKQTGLFIALCVFFSLGIVAISLSVAFGLVIYDTRTYFVRPMVGLPPPARVGLLSLTPFASINAQQALPRQLYIEMQIINLDPNPATFTIDVHLSFDESNMNCSTGTLREIDIFMDRYV